MVIVIYLLSPKGRTQCYDVGLGYLSGLHGLWFHGRRACEVQLESNLANVNDTLASAKGNKGMSERCELDLQELLI